MLKLELQVENKRLRQEVEQLEKDKQKLIESLTDAFIDILNNDMCELNISEEEAYKQNAEYIKVLEDKTGKSIKKLLK